MNACPPDRHQLKSLFVTRFELPEDSLSVNTPIFSGGLLDSFHLIDLLGYLERDSGIRITPGEISLDNFDTLERLEAFLRRKASATP